MYNEKIMKRIDLFFTAVFVPLDFLMLIFAAISAYFLRFSSSAESIRPVTFDLPLGEYLGYVVPITIIWLAIYALAGLYNIRPHRLAGEVTRVFLASSTGIAAILAIAFFSRELFDSRFILLAVWALAILFVGTERIIMRLIERALRKYDIGMKHVVIIGKTHSGNKLHQYFDKYPRLGYAIIDQVGSFNEETKQKILELKKYHNVDVLMLANPGVTLEEVQAIKTFSDIESMTFIYSADMFPGSAVRPILHTFAGQPVIEVPKTPLDGWGAIYKRLFDIVGAFCLILLTLPIQIITVIALALEHQHHILFRHERVGQGGKSFKYFKFRSMIKDAHKFRFDPEFLRQHGNDRDGTPLFKLENDPRITRVGKFIRRYSIDEIPEFYLVLFGRMSLVGPRPHLPEEVKNYASHQKRVLNIKPGITGMAQTSGRADLSFDEEVRLDIYYIENWSPWLDLIILIKTPIAVLFGAGAY
ncbi:sugar transferase [Patescibacteria group bacterium]|nr:sugar transferase [Patescibacteria group bacterium]